METGKIGDYLSFNELDGAKIRFAVKSACPEMDEWQRTGLVNRIFSLIPCSRETRIELPSCVEFESKSGQLILINSKRARQLIEAVL